MRTLAASRIVEIEIEEGAFAGPGFGPGINRSSLGGGGGPEDVFAFLLWIASRPRRRRRSRQIGLTIDQKWVLRILRSIDAARMLQLARANAGMSS
jgi:hypothetical protein